MIIGLVGLKNSGKDTVGAYLIKQYGFDRRSFAAPLKESIAALFNIKYADVERMKNGLKTMVQVGPDEYGNHRVMSFREFMQRYGTEAHRDTFGPNFWVDQCLPKQSYLGNKIVITDVRFHTEADRIKEVGGYLIRVIRHDLVDDDTHQSEQEQKQIMVDLNILNDGTIEELHDNVEGCLTILANERYDR